MIAPVTPRIQLILLFFFIAQFSFARIHPVIMVNEPSESRDLGLTHTLSHERVAAGDALILVFSLLNHDEQAAQDIEIRLDLPEAFWIESFTSERGEFLEHEGVWRIKSLAGRNDVSLQLSLLNTSHVDLAFSASIEAATPKLDPIEQNNVTQGVIRVKEEDCMVVFDDFAREEGESSCLYIDCVEQYPNNVLYIYDREGTLVFEQEGYDNSWDGKRHPRFTKYGWDELPKGTYYYVLSFPKAERSDKSGWIDISD